MKIAPAAAAVPAALGSAIFTRNVPSTTPGINSGRTLEMTLAMALIRCLSQLVKRMTIAKPMHEQTALMRPAFVMLFANASSDCIGAPPIQAIRIPAPISTTRASWPLINR